MIKNQDIICISSIDWDFIWQGHQEIMSAFAQGGNRVLFIENTGIRTPILRDMPRLKKRIVSWLKSVKGFREETKNLYVYSPITLPFPYSRVARWINKYILIRPIERWMKIMNFSTPIIWTFLPTGTALDIIDNINSKLVIYYCIADFYELADNINKVKRTEDELIRKCNLIFAQGKELADKCSKFNDSVHIFRFGVNIKNFEEFKGGPLSIPDDIRNIKKPIIGYIGGVHKHIDLALIRFIAQAHPEWSIVLIGPLQTDVTSISDINNIYLLGKKDFSLLPNYIQEFNAGIIPYLRTGYTETVFPTKLNEYHIMGKPVVSTDLPEVAKFNEEYGNLVMLANSYEEFIRRLIEAMDAKNYLLYEKRKASAVDNSWEVIINKMSVLIEEKISERSAKPILWQENIIKLYRKAHVKILKFISILLMTYFILFYTSLMWIVANPLRIYEKPKNADCIVVFAGGVGESGRALQGYEERVQYAVELYNQGYAKMLLFSSGYSYVYKETLMMKALAVSLGVPGKAIILEDKAKNTYENVIFSHQILSKNLSNKILLISSPYNMRRVSFVFKKNVKDTEVTYTPIPNSLFYSHPAKDEYGLRIWKRISLRQIKGIIHEYEGIVYYWLKGWI